MELSTDSPYWDTFQSKLLTYPSAVHWAELSLIMILLNFMLPVCNLSDSYWDVDILDNRHYPSNTKYALRL